MQEDQNRKRKITLLIVGVLVLLLVVLGATYAFFQAQLGTGKDINANVSTGTTDNLTFSMSDINRNVEPNKEDNVLDEENEKTEIIINANQNNFGKTNKSLGDGVRAKALLKANNTTNEAIKYYNVFFVLEEPMDRLVYTIDEDHPELILTVIDPDDEEVTEIEGLIYHKKDESNPNDVSGFDITGRVDSFAIKRKQEIKVGKEDNDHQTEQEWKIKVTLINFPENDQKNNTGKEINGSVIITTEDDENAYKLAHVSSIKDTSSTVNSITTTMEYEQGSKEIKKYYFGIEEIGEVASVSLEDVTRWEEDEDATHTFTELKDNYNYKIYCYIEDTEGIKSNIYGTEIENIVTTEKLPKVKEIKVTSKSYNEINISVETEEGTNEISGYEYTIKGATIEGGSKIEETISPTHTFDNLSELQDYTIEVRVKDNKGNYSVISTITETTLQKKTYTLLATNTTIEGQDAQLTNLMEDGSFENELKNWTFFGSGKYEFVSAVETHGTKMLKMCNQNDVDITARFTKFNTFKPILNHSYYGRSMFLSSLDFNIIDSRLVLVAHSNITDLNFLHFYKVINDKMELVSNISVRNNNNDADGEWDLWFFVRGSNVDVYMDELMVMDLTASYGDDIPTQEWLDKNLMYFDGTANIKTIESGDQAEFKVANGTGSIRCNNNGVGSIDSDGTVNITGTNVNTTCIIE